MVRDIATLGDSSRTLLETVQPEMIIAGRGQLMCVICLLINNDSNFHPYQSHMGIPDKWLNNDLLYLHLQYDVCIIRIPHAFICILYSVHAIDKKLHIINMRIYVNRIYIYYIYIDKYYIYIHLPGIYDNINRVYVVMPYRQVTYLPLLALLMVYILYKCECMFSLLTRIILHSHIYYYT